jgi:hypothetical protein
MALISHTGIFFSASSCGRSSNTKATMDATNTITKRQCCVLYQNGGRFVWKRNAFCIKMEGVSIQNAGDFREITKDLGGWPCDGWHDISHIRRSGFPNHPAH